MLPVKGNPLPFSLNKSADNNLLELGNKLYLVPEKKKDILPYLETLLYAGSYFISTTK